jgi:hypothetical protein
MLRHKLLLGTMAALSGVAALPAAAQFGQIFGGPPRPPADVPQAGPPAGDDRYFQSGPRQQQMWTRDPRVVSPPPGGYPPPPPPQYGYPQQGYPPPPGYPQQAARPPDVQQQDLPPPPGGSAAPPSASLPGLPPGQRQPRGTPPQPASVQPGDTPATPAPQNEEVLIAPPAQKIPNTTAVFSGLDKITGRIITFDVAINETVQFGALQVTPRACYTRPVTEAANTDGFVEADEITLQGEIKRVFTGWMFAASPGLHAIEHPIYDVWLTDCKGAQQPAVAAAPEAVPAPQPQRPAQRAKQKQAAPVSSQPQTLPPPTAQQQPLPPPPGAPIQLR